VGWTELEGEAILGLRVRDEEGAREGAKVGFRVGIRVGALVGASLGAEEPVEPV
jgi:hypothetical protein